MAEYLAWAGTFAIVVIGILAGFTAVGRWMEDGR
jgi:hypothetical protein